MMERKNIAAKVSLVISMLLFIGSLFMFVNVQRARSETGKPEPGSAEDPVITLSYFSQELGSLKAELSSVKSELSSVKEELKKYKEELDKYKSQSGSSGSSGGTQEETPPKTLGTGIVKVTALNVRSGPGTNYSKVGSVKLNDKLTLVSKKGEWYEIKFGSLKGWVHGAYIKVQ